MRDRPADRQFAVPGRAGGTPRAAALLLSSQPGSRLFLQRAGLQRHLLPAGPGERHPLRRADITTLPEGYTARNTCSQIHLTPSGQFLYVANRGHNSIAAFALDPASGHLISVGQVPTEAVPGAFALDPAGRFLVAAGTVSGRLASYRIDGASGRLTPLATYAAGQRPAAVLATRLGD